MNKKKRIKTVGKIKGKTTVAENLKKTSVLIGSNGKELARGTNKMELVRKIHG